MDNRGRIVARDIYEHKIELINQAVKRLGIGIIETEVLMPHYLMKNLKAGWIKF